MQNQKNISALVRNAERMARNSTLPKHMADNLSYEQMIASGFEEEISDHANHEFMIMDELDEAVKEIRKVDPKYAMAIYLRKYIGLSREETANQMCVSARTVDHYVAQAVKIGKQFRKRHEQ